MKKLEILKNFGNNMKKEIMENYETIENIMYLLQHYTNALGGPGSLPLEIKKAENTKKKKEKKEILCKSVLICYHSMSFRPRNEQYKKHLCYVIKCRDAKKINNII